MEFTESLQEEGLLLVVGESQSLDGLGGMSGTLVDLDGRVAQASGTPWVLGNSSALVVRFVSNVDGVNLLESLLLLGVLLLTGETIGGAAS